MIEPTQEVMYKRQPVVNGLLSVTNLQVNTHPPSIKNIQNETLYHSLWFSRPFGSGICVNTFIILNIFYIY